MNVRASQFNFGISAYAGYDATANQTAKNRKLILSLRPPFTEKTQTFYFYILSAPMTKGKSFASAPLSITAPAAIPNQG